MSGWMDDLLGKDVYNDGTLFPARKKLNFKPVSSVLIEDNPTTGATDVTILGGGATAVVTSAGGTTALTNADSGKTLINSAAAQWNLPAAEDGLGFEVVNAVAGGTTIKAHGTDVIEFLTAASTAGGTQSSVDIYASVRVRAIGTKWIAIGSPNGSWLAA